MKLVLTHECGDILLIDPESNSNQLVTSIDNNILKEKYKNICLIDHRVKLESFEAVFCMMIPKCVEINLENIDNDKIILYTFTDDSHKLKMDVSKMHIQNTNLNIATHFLQHISHTKNIGNHAEIEREINMDCHKKMELDMRAFNEVNEICINDTYEKSLCHSFMKRMVLHAKHRFNHIERDEIVELPFRKDDYIYYKYTCSYKEIVQVYMIRIIMV